MEGIEGLLLDIDGVVVGPDGGLVPGADRAIRAFRRRGLAVRFATNTTTRPRRALAARLRSLGIEAVEDDIVAPAALARRVVRASARPSYRLLGAPALVEDLGADLLAEEGAVPGWVVLGLHPPDLRHERLARALRELLAGARLLALHANRRWRTAAGMEPGLGAYVRALEYAAETEALVVGKPSRAFFDEAVAALGLPGTRVAMVGDDLEADVGGARAAGLRAVLTLSGKTDRADLDRPGRAEPDLVVRDLAELADLLAG